MNENEFTYKGIQYVARVNDISCPVCDFLDADCSSLIEDRKVIPSCVDSERSDGRDVIFLRKST